MSTIAYQIRIDAPQPKVWKTLADFGGVHKYSPGVKSSHITSQNGQGVGAARHCNLKPAGSVEERIIEWKEGKYYVLEIYDGKSAPPFKSAVGKLSVELDGDETVVTARVEYSLKYGFVGVAMDRLVVGRFLKKGFQSLLGGLKHYVETGEEVRSTNGLDLTAVATSGHRQANAVAVTERSQH